MTNIANDANSKLERSVNVGLDDLSAISRGRSGKTTISLKGLQFNGSTLWMGPFDLAAYVMYLVTSHGSGSRPSR